MTAIDTNGFPLGYFIIKSVASDRVLDIFQDQVEDGTEVILYPEKETSLVEARRDPNANNQVFFIDTTGALCSRASGHALDVVEDRLVIAHRHPMTPYPTAYSHPLAKFEYRGDTGEIAVTPGHPPSQKRSHLLTAVPLQRPRTVLDDASEFLTSAITAPLSLFSGASASKATPDQVYDGEIDLHESEIAEEDRTGVDAEIDDSPEKGRKVRVLAVDGDDKDLHVKAIRRRQWRIISLRAADARTK